MAEFSDLSKARLATAHPDLQRLFNEVIKTIDCVIICGHRNQDEQESAYAEHKTLEHWPHSKHNSIPSLAVDAMPGPLDWDAIGKIAYFAGQVIQIAAGLGIKVRWGGGFKKLKDLDHFELVETDGL